MLEIILEGGQRRGRQLSEVDTRNLENWVIF